MSPPPLRRATPASRSVNQGIILRFATWNVQTLNDSSSAPARAELLVQRLTEYSIETCCLTEVRWPGSGIKTVDGWTIAFSGRDDGLRRHVVGIAMTPLAAHSLLSIETISDGVRMALFQLRGRKSSVICAYAPTNDYREREKTIFYSKLQDALDRISGRDLMLNGGDFNAQVGAEDPQSWQVVSANLLCTEVI